MKFVESDKARRRIEGYASTRDLDRTGEIVEPGAFADSLKDFMANPILTYMHDWSDPIGKVVRARIDDLGLYITAEVSETAHKVWTLIEEGILRAFSIGYEVLDEKVIDGANHILKLRLYEVAVVSIPANRRALFSVSKALEAGDDLVRECRTDCLVCEKRHSTDRSSHVEIPTFSDTALDEARATLKEVMAKLGAE
jgi:HK97 family phage prohead protease